jgi:RNase HI (EC 3.1.26.4)
VSEVDIYTDGACRGNPGPGGWAAVLRGTDYEKILQGAEAETTNNRMELTAAVRALDALGQPRRVTLYTDSEYRAKRYQRMAAGMEDAWLENRRQEAGEESGFVAAVGCGGWPACGEMALGTRARGQSG